MDVEERKFKIFFGNGNVIFNDSLRSYFEKKFIGSMVVEKFSDGEIRVEVCDSVQNFEVYIVQSICGSVNDSLMELILIVDAIKRAGPSKITAVIPYFAYARQDRITGINSPISAKVVANMIVMSGVETLITIDLHSDQICGFFDIPVDNISFISVILEYIKKEFDNLETIIVSPDAGGFNRAVKFSEKFGCDVGYINKIRPSYNESVSLSLIGNVNDKSVIILDDMVDTAGTLVETVNLINRFSPKNITVFATHAVLSGNSLSKITDSNIDKLIVSNTIPLKEKFVNIGFISVLSVARLFADKLKNKFCK